MIYRISRLFYHACLSTQCAELSGLMLDCRLSQFSTAFPLPSSNSVSEIISGDGVIFLFVFRTVSQFFGDMIFK
jgi:hypothetical protein